jgi:hypothetical protein
LYLPETGSAPIGAMDAMDQPDPLALTEREQAIVDSWSNGTEAPEMVSAEDAEKLEQHFNMEETDSGLMVPGEDESKSSELGFLTKTGNLLRGTRAGRAVTAFVIAVSAAGTYSLVNAETAQAGSGDQPAAASSSDQPPCVDSVESQCSYTPPANPPSSGDNGGQDNDPPKQGGSVHQPKNGPDSKADSQENFPGYNMEDTSFTDHNGCFVTSAASALRRVTGDSHITPRKIYYPALRKLWSPSSGVKGGLLFDALPSIASHFDVKVYKIDSARGALRAVRKGDQVQMLAAPPSHFTYGGHYLDARATTPNGKKLILDDPNGRGLHGDSERRSGWSPSQLVSAGIVDYRGLHLITR